MHSHPGCSWICSPGSKTPEEANWARQRLRPKKIRKMLVDPWLKLRLPGGPSASRWQLDQLSRIAAIPRKGGVFDSGNTGAPSSNERISRSIRCAKTGSFLRLFWHIYSKFSLAKEPMRNKITAKLDRKSTLLNSSHYCAPRMPSSD